MKDDDNVSIETNMLGLREDVKAQITDFASKNPMEGSFRAVQSHAYNLENVRALREKYPEEYARRMQTSSVKPLNEDGQLVDSQWYAHTLAGNVLNGILDSDHLHQVKQYFDEDNLGIPPEFLELPEIREHIKKMIKRPWANEEVSNYIRDRFKIDTDPNEKIKRYPINNRQFE